MPHEVESALCPSAPPLQTALPVPPEALPRPDSWGQTLPTMVKMSPHPRETAAGPRVSESLKNPVCGERAEGLKAGPRGAVHPAQAVWPQTSDISECRLLEVTTKRAAAIRGRAWGWLPGLLGPTPGYGAS